MRQAECVAGLARSDHGVEGAARALGARPAGSSHRRRVTPTASAPPRQRHGAVDTAAHRDGDPAGRPRGAEDGTERVGDGVCGQRLAGDSRRLEKCQADERPRHPWRVGLDDPLAVHDEARDGVRLATGRVADPLRPSTG